MDFRLTDEQVEFQQKCRQFSAEVIRPVAAKYDREQSVPWDVIKEARKWDLHGLEYIQKVASDPDGLFGVIYAEENFSDAPHPYDGLLKVIRRTWAAEFSRESEMSNF